MRSDRSPALFRDLLCLETQTGPSLLSKMEPPRRQCFLVFAPQNIRGHENLIFIFFSPSCDYPSKNPVVHLIFCNFKCPISLYNLPLVTVINKTPMEMWTVATGHRKGQWRCASILHRVILQPPPQDS